MTVTGCGALGSSGHASGTENRPRQLHADVYPAESGNKIRQNSFAITLTTSSMRSRIALNGLKVLCDAPGFDAWHDTSTLVFEGTGPEGRYRGILRYRWIPFSVSSCPASTSAVHRSREEELALGAFYKYFAGEVSDVYLERAASLKDALLKLVTGIHV